MIIKTEIKEETPSVPFGAWGLIRPISRYSHGRLRRFEFWTFCPIIWNSLLCRVTISTGQQTEAGLVSVSFSGVLFLPKLELIWNYRQVCTINLVVLANVLLLAPVWKKKSDRWAPGSSFEKFSDRGLSFTSPHKKFILLECLSTCCVLFPRMFEYIYQYIHVHFLSVCTWSLF